MSNALVKYHNTINTVAFKDFNARELNLFFALCSIMRDTELEEITIEYKDLKEVLDVPFPNNKVFEDTLKTLYNKLLHLDIEMDTEESYIKFVLFTEYIIHKGKSVTIQTNQRFYHILNELTKNFTLFELKEFSSLKSSYSKNMYRLLKQYKSTGKLFLTTDEFRRLLDIPESYAWFRINDKVLKKIEEELPDIFPGLNIEKKKKGTVITHINITFNPDPDKEAINTESQPEGQSKKIKSAAIPATIEYEKPIEIKQKKKTEQKEDLHCPYCGEELQKIEKKDGTSFYGHPNFKKGTCNKTFALNELKLAQSIAQPFKPKTDILTDIKLFCEQHSTRFQFIYKQENTAIIKDILNSKKEVTIIELKIDDNALNKLVKML